MAGEGINIEYANLIAIAQRAQRSFRTHLAQEDSDVSVTNRFLKMFSGIDKRMDVLRRSDYFDSRHVGILRRELGV